MKGRIFLLSILLFVVASLFGCGGSSAPSTAPNSDGIRNTEWYPSPTVLPILAGKTLNVGTVTISNDLTMIHITYNITAPNWSMTETHVALATSLSGIPQANGNPVPGKFPYKATHNPAVTTFTYNIPLGDWNEDTCLYVATHCALQQKVNGKVVQTQTGWTGDHGFPGKNWALYFDYCIEECGINLPADPVCVTMHYPGANSYWSHDLSNVPTGYDVANGNFLSWCLQQNVYAYPENLYCDVKLIAVTDPALPAIFNGMQFDKINWVLNHKNGASIIDIQTAIWYFTGAGAYPTTPAAIALVVDADTFGDGYVPGPGEILAAIVYIADNVQSTFIEVECGC
jgi:hypothetical protein